MLTTLTQKCHALRTDPTLICILLDGIKGWLHDILLPLADYPTAYHSLILELTTIGWSHVFQGRISNRWAETQQWYYIGFPKVRGRDGPSWSRKILRHIFSHWNILWDMRNTDLHGKDVSTKAKSSKDQAVRELTHLYTFRTLVLQRDKDVFHTTLESHKSQPTRTIRQWINTYQPLILKSAKDAKDNSLLHVRPITTYFGTG